MSATPTRRHVVKTAVWTVPIVAGVGAIPSYAAASGPSAAITAGGSCKHADYVSPPEGPTLYKYHLTLHCISTYGTPQTLSIGSVTTGSTSAYQYVPNPMIVPPNTSDQVLEVFFDVVASDPIVVVGSLNGATYTLAFTDFNACGISTP